MAYVPPSRRLSPKSEDFPVLGNPKSNVAAPWGAGKSFATLANDWRKKEERDEFEENLRLDRERKAEERERIQNSNFTFHSSTRESHVVASVPVEEEEDDYTETLEEEDDWTTVKKKERRILTPEERYARMVEREEQQEEAEANCGDDEWDVRDRRVCS